MKNFWSIFISVSIWAVIIALCFVFLRNCNRPQFFTVSMAEDSLAKEMVERKGIVDWSQLQVDSTGVVSLAANIDSVSFVALKNKILREEALAGRLLTANQMSEKITGYYDKLIDVLIALFVVFTVVSYFAIRNLSKKEVRDEAREILEDSSKFKGDVLENLRGEFDGAYLSHDEYDEILRIVQEDIVSIKESIEGIRGTQAKAAAKPTKKKTQTVKEKVQPKK